MFFSSTPEGLSRNPSIVCFENAGVVLERGTMLTRP